MKYSGSICLKEIIDAFTEFGSETEVFNIKQRVIKRRGGIPVHYKSERSCKETIQRIIENYCPESDNYSSDRLAYFNRTGHGKYKLIPVNERGHQEAKAKAHTRNHLKRPEALRVMSEYYQSNKNSLPNNISSNRDNILDKLMLGEDVSSVFSTYVTTNKAET